MLLNRDWLNRRNFAISGLNWLGGICLASLISPIPANALSSKGWELSDAEWRKRLSPRAYAVLRRAATEAPFSSPLNKEHRKGVFSCAGCDLPLFASATKFDSGTGWPSFYDHLPGAIAERADKSLPEERTEVHCGRCGGHLGHVFHDGPRPTGLRYCMNGVALTFHPA
ncbi:peptide-methionine (R)-S-oxide reductase MsrB [Sphingomonas sp. CL5.1]|uniref:peptide-methionine (R)-S-oxide reductase MsrB n=1 Tax=Sphingomonas sp. CL5.1 TaxID=2653203 RepID=UPI001584366E|nr:peptide-methionine (R)-S-oxide reductase MsrB [Sphingomonas sp. CL5.1]QKS01161.1 peptide-methionine (R)-S-oxide reductase MsrB [Sphingomonas sp. CL5.1]